MENGEIRDSLNSGKVLVFSWENNPYDEIIVCLRSGKVRTINLYNNEASLCNSIDEFLSDISQGDDILIWGEAK